MGWPWGGSSDKPTGPSTPQNDTSQQPQTVTPDLKKAAPNVNPKPTEREKLPPKLQKIVDKTEKEESFYDELVEG